MSDLFGDEVSAIKAASLIQLDYGFEEWWKVYPSHPRKVGKAWCMNAWKTRRLSEISTHIRDYTIWRAEQKDWAIDGFIQMPKTFINAAGWIDWEPHVVHKKPTALDKIKADDKLAVKPSAEIRERIKQIKGRS